MLRERLTDEKPNTPSLHASTNPTGDREELCYSTDYGNAEGRVAVNEAEATLVRLPDSRLRDLPWAKLRNCPEPLHRVQRWWCSFDCANIERARELRNEWHFLEEKTEPVQPADLRRWRFRVQESNGSIRTSKAVRSSRRRSGHRKNMNSALFTEIAS